MLRRRGPAATRHASPPARAPTRPHPERYKENPTTPATPVAERLARSLCVLSQVQIPLRLPTSEQPWHLYKLAVHMRFVPKQKRVGGRGVVACEVKSQNRRCPEISRSDIETEGNHRCILVIRGWSGRRHSIDGRLGVSQVLL